MKLFVFICTLVLGMNAAWAQQDIYAAEPEFVQYSDGAIEFSRITYEYGYGREFATCSNRGSFCIDDVKRRAEQTATYDGRRRCEMNRGRPEFGSPYCNTRCSPNYIPPGSKPVQVFCDATCTIRCEVP